jgi:uncharacterized protein with ATP-grasp and redox domains
VKLHGDIMREVLAIAQHADMNRPPAYTTTFIHRTIRQMLGADPFESVKKKYNSVAIKQFPLLQKKVQESRDPLWTATRLAIAGNIIDFGIYTSVDINGAVNRSLKTGIGVDDYQPFQHEVQQADSILYLLDNAGEVVFDKLLIEVLASSGKKVTAVVKGAPVLNDVTRDDAEQTGLDTICEVIDNGSDAVGTIIAMTSPVFQREFNDAELIISKGQGNFETVSETGRNAFFLFQSKCDVVSRELGLVSGSMLLMKS